MMKSTALWYVFTVLLCFADAARILGVVPTASYSHQVAFQPIWRELSLRGHQVTTITTNPIKDPKLVNLTEIDLHSCYKITNENVQEMAGESPYKFLFAVIKMIEETTHKFLSHIEVQRLIRNETEHFDVVMIELGLSPMFAFAKRFNAPLIVITSLDASNTLLKFIGNPTHPVIYPDMIMPFEDNKSISDRLVLVIFDIFIKLFIMYLDATHQIFVDKYFGSDYPSLYDLSHNISLALINSDPIFHKVKPLVPTVVQIGGGSHRVAPKPLPKELKEVLDAAASGFIYFSLGSNAKSVHLSKETLNVILSTFAELPYTVLWKFDSDELENKPKNLITSKWFPQQDVFKHPNIKLFITQGGLQSMDEAIYDHIPMLGMPFFADQFFNVNKMVKRGFGLSVDHKTLTKNEFKATILEVINNPKYRKRIRELAELASDQPMTGLEKAVWWTEYVIRHKGTRHLRSPLLDVPFYQYYLLDVVAVCLLFLIVLISVLVFTLKCIWRRIKKVTSSVKQKIN